MQARGLVRLGRSLLLPLLLAPGSVSLAAQTGEPRPDTLTLILEELRQLRRSMELTALLQMKVQVAAERLKVREPQVRALTEQAGHIEQALAASAVDIQRTRAELDRVDVKIAQETTAESRRELNAERSALAETIEQMSAQEEENQRRAATIAESLAAERAEMDQLSEALTELELSLERHVRGTAGPQDGKVPR